MSTFEKTLSKHKSRKHKQLCKVQEAQRKDIEGAFEVFHSRFAIDPGLAYFWSKYVLANIMIDYVFLHNMIIEDEKDMSSPLTMKILQQSSGLTGTQAAFKHFLRRTERLKAVSPIIN